MRKIIVVIDMQNDFIDGTLGTKEAQAIVAAVKAKIQEYPREDVYATRDTHHADYLQTQEGALLPVTHCVEGTEGWQIRVELATLIDESHIINKPSFGSLDLAALLVQENKKEALHIELVGLCTDICVVSNALILKAFLPEVPIQVDSSCCAGVSPHTHAAALETMRSCQIQIV